MADERETKEVAKGANGPWLVYVVVALIVGLLLLFLLLRPRGVRAAVSEHAMLSEHTLSGG